MNTIDRLSDRGTHLVSQARHALSSTSSHLPKWLEAGAAVGIARTGVRAATSLARRNPALVIAVGVLGAGVLAYRFYRKRANAQAADARPAIQGKIGRNGAGDSIEEAGHAADGHATDGDVRKNGKSKAKSRERARPRAH